MRSRIALLSRMKDALLGKTTLAKGERGWVKDSYRNAGMGHVRHPTMCLNGALALAEYDLFNVKLDPEEYGLYSGDTPDRSDIAQREELTKEGEDAKRLLAETIVEMYPGLTYFDRKPVTVARVKRLKPNEVHEVIVDFNDDEETSQDDITAVLEKCEQKAYDRWLEDQKLGPPVDSEALV